MVVIFSTFLLEVIEITQKLEKGYSLGKRISQKTDTMALIGQNHTLVTRLIVRRALRVRTTLIT